MLHSHIEDDFLMPAMYDQLREYADTAQYMNIASPVDGVVYPDICPEIPPRVLGSIDDRLDVILGSHRTHLIFMRLSVEGVKAPHYAHTDATMGRYSLMLYLTDGPGGTALVKHTTGMVENPRTHEEQQIWERDTNRVECWEPYLLCPMKPNRAFIFRADLFHAALPYGGFGSDAKNGRLVMTAFLS